MKRTTGMRLLRNWIAAALALAVAVAIAVNSDSFRSCTADIRGDQSIGFATVRRTVGDLECFGSIITKENEGSAVAWFTVVLAVSTILLWFATRDAAKAAERAADMAERELVSTQRAFVFLKTFESHQLGDVLRVLPQWENSGATPTRSMTNYINWKFFPQDTLAADYPFPDLDPAGNPTHNPETVPIVLGPRSTQYGHRIDIPFRFIEAVRIGNGRLLIWGHCRYLDVFEEHTVHFTKFCHEVEALTLPSDEGGKVSVAVMFSLYHQGNSAG